MSFTIFYKKKTPFQAIKTRSSKSRKINIFPMLLVQKWPFFQLFFKAIQARKKSFRYFRTNKTHFYTIKTRSSKSRNISLFPKGVTHGFNPIMAIFPTFFFSQYRPGKCLLRYFRTKKTPFYTIKTRSSKSRKISLFPKGVTHGFNRVMTIFPTFSFQSIQARKMSFTIFQHEKTPFYAIKIRSSKSRKIDFFPNASTYGFGPKMAIFPFFFFLQ